MYIISYPPGIVVDQNQALRFAINIARGMEFLHFMDPMIYHVLYIHVHVHHILSTRYRSRPESGPEIRYWYRQRDGIPSLYGSHDPQPHTDQQTCHGE